MFNHLWYQALNKPPLTPPAYVFAPAWIFLYCTIFVSIVIYTTTFSYKNKIKGYILFVSQIVLNLLWTPAFFIFKNILLGLVIIILFDIVLIYTIKEFYKVSKISAYILLPYLVWIIFATYLNLGIFILNK